MSRTRRTYICSAWPIRPIATWVTTRSQISHHSVCSLQHPLLSILLRPEDNAKMATPQASSSSSTQETYLSTSEGGITPASVIAVGAVLSGLAVIAVALRFYVRLIRVYASLGVEDWLILVSVVLTLGMGLMMIIGLDSPFLGQIQGFCLTDLGNPYRLCDGRSSTTDSSGHRAKGIPDCDQRCRNTDRAGELISFASCPLGPR